MGLVKPVRPHSNTLWAAVFIVFLVVVAQEWIAKLDIAGFKDEIQTLGSRLAAEQGTDDVAHLNKVCFKRLDYFPSDQNRSEHLARIACNLFPLRLLNSTLPCARLFTLEIKSCAQRPRLTRSSLPQTALHPPRRVSPDM